VTKQIVILRDPYNLLASLFRHFINRKGKIWFVGKWVDKQELIDASPSLFAKKWLEYAKLFESGDVIGINYNKWVVDKEYRDEIAKEIGVDFRTDKSMSSVPRNGGGSSFDKTSKNGSGETMDVIERWRNYIDDEDYLNIFKENPELEVISKRIFGDVINRDQEAA
jgi:hypothetical protein